MEERSSKMGSSPRTAEEIFREYSGRRTDAVHALTNEREREREREVDVVRGMVHRGIDGLQVERGLTGGVPGGQREREIDHPNFLYSDDCGRSEIQNEKIVLCSTIDGFDVSFVRSLRSLLPHLFDLLAAPSRRAPNFCTFGVSSGICYQTLPTQEAAVGSSNQVDLFGQI